MANAVEVLRQEREKLMRQVKVLDEAIVVVGGAARPGKRHLSAEARKKLSEAGKRRWSGQKKK
jgi:hypothetical protein